ncbi:hypothetical protein [Natronomonas marina]|uniref:hypothetical protein n=1 Tax=Natronomonas marina TaxID=2961939 RepID=UPI0020C9AB16|nr:hypothetical protein [Natronomonas marina]
MVATEDGRVADTIPAAWTVDTAFGDAVAVEETENGKRVILQASGDGELTYFTEAPEGLSSTGRYEFGPVEVEQDGEYTAVDGTSESVSVVGASTEL